MNCHVPWRMLIGCLVVFASPSSWSALFDIQPTLILNEIYSDNIFLNSKNEEEEYISQVIPGIKVERQGRKMNVYVDYSWEKLLYYRESRLNTSYNRLQAQASAMVDENKFFIDAAGSIRQQVINNQSRLVLDNINPAARTEIKTYSIGPTLRNHFGSIADSEVVFRTGKVDYGNTDQFSDSDILRLNASVKSGRRFSGIRWNAAYSLNETRRAIGDNSKYELVEGQIASERYRHLNWFINGGFINDDIQAIRAVNDGYFFSVGLRWKPAANLILSGEYGYNNESASIEYRPTKRAAFLLGYKNRNLGTNPGTRWSVLFRHNARRYSWNLTYEEDTSNLQQLEFSAGTNPSLVNLGGVLIDRNSLVFSPSNEDFIRKSIQFNFSITRAKSNIQLRLGGERRDFLDSTERDQYTGGNIQWAWRISGRSNLAINAGYLSRHFGFDQIDDLNLYGGIAVIRNISRNIQGQLSYRYVARDGSEGSLGDYQENRVNLGVKIAY